MNKILVIILLFICNTLNAKDNYKTKSLKVSVSPVYSVNGNGIKYYPAAIYNGTAQPDPVPSGYSYRPAVLNVANNVNFAAGIDYEFYLKNRWFVGGGINYATSHLTLQYINNPLSVQNGEVPKEYAAYVHEYKDNTNLFGIGVHGGKQFKICKTNDRLFEVKIGVNFIFNTNKLPDFESSSYLEQFQAGTQSYFVPYLETNMSDYRIRKAFQSLGYQTYLYIGSEGKRPIIKNSRIYGFYGIQVDVNPSQGSNSSKIATFRTQYAYFMKDQDVRFKYQQIDFNRQGILNFALKFGLMLK